MNQYIFFCYRLLVIMRFLFEGGGGFLFLLVLGIGCVILNALLSFSSYFNKAKYHLYNFQN